MSLNENKFILDATAGFRMMWFDKNQPNTIYLDNRDDNRLLKDANQFGKNRGRPLFKKWDPTISTTKGDYRKLPYPNGVFKLVIFDPPHLLGSGSPRFQMGLCFGALKAETWPSDIKQAANELWRVLAPWGILLFKWNDSDINYEKVLRLFPTKPLLGQITANRHTKRKEIKTFWFCFMKIPNEKSAY